MLTLRLSGIRRKMVATVLTLACCGFAPSFIFAADSLTLEERVARLEAQLSAVLDENAALRKQLQPAAKPAESPAAPAPAAAAAPAKPAPTAVVAAGRENKFSLGGFLHLNGEFGDAADARFPANDRFLLRRVRFGAKGSFADNLDFALQVDLASNSLGSISGYRVQATDMYIAWAKYPAATITVGQFKTPYGYEQLLADTKTISIERTLANDLLTLGRQAGAMFSGSILEKKLTYGFAIGNGNGANVSFNDNDQFMYIGRVAGTPFAGKQARLTLGANAYSSRDTGSFTGRRTGFGLDAQLAFGGAEIDVEWLNTQFDRDTGTDFDARGWSVIGSYFFVPKKWQGFVLYESFDPSDAVGADDTTMSTIGLNYLIKGDDLKLSLNYLLGDPPTTSKNQGRLIGRLQVAF
jgi:phosphate-selective porin OprO and OprP